MLLFHAATISPSSPIDFRVWVATSPTSRNAGVVTFCHRWWRERRHALLAVFLYPFLIGSCMSGQATDSQEREINGFRFFEEIVVTTVPYTSGFIGKEQRHIPIIGVLWTPYGSHPRPYPLLISNHGSQDGGTELSPQPRATKIFLEKGFAVFLPIRKGFSRKGSPPSEATADLTEPIECNDYAKAEQGLQSATSDVRALYQVLAQRADLDLTRVTVMGVSRGGFLALALAAEGMPGVQRVLNFSGGWYSEKCYAEFNSKKFEEFGNRIRLPILSFYGDADNYYSLRHIQSNLRSLNSGGFSSSHILPGGDHSLFSRNPEFWIPIVFGDIERQTGD